MEEVKARKAPPYEGRPAWYGLWLDGGVWRLVRNDQELPIIYKTEQAALDAARYVSGG